MQLWAHFVVDNSDFDSQLVDTGLLAERDCNAAFSINDPSSPR
jgi:hypothetical protein